MGELEERISSVLNDPEQMDKIARLAKNLMGGQADTQPPADLGIDPTIIGRIGKLMGESGSRSGGMLEAMKPYLSEKRRNKVDRAIKLTRIARLARLAMDDAEGDANV